MHTRAIMSLSRSYAGALTTPPGESKGGKPTPRCQKCAKIGETLIDLKCAMHYLCKDCLQQKTKEEGWQEMYVCRVCPAEHHEPPVYAFVDHANLWITAKRLGKERRGFDSSEDHRIRIYYKGLQKLIAPAGEKVKVYTSSSDKLDLRHCESFEVTELQVSSSGKQKQVDTMIVRDILALLRDVPYSMRGTVVLVSGDADMIPALEDIAAEKRWTVKIFSWDGCTANELRKFQQPRSNVSIVALDDHWNELVYKNSQITIEAITEVDYKKCLVLTISRSGGFSTERSIDRTHPEWLKKIEDVSKWPVQYCWLPTGEAKYLLLLFKGIKMDSETLVGKIKRLPQRERLLHIERCQTYLQYSEKVKQGPTRRYVVGKKYSDMVKPK